MMHELEKSGPSIVAVKLANASGRSELESMERREWTCHALDLPRFSGRVEALSVT